MTNTLLHFLTLCVSTLSVFARDTNGISPADLPFTLNPYLDPKKDVLNPLRYITSNALTSVAVVLVIIVAVAQTWCIKRWGAVWMSSMTIGAYFFALGLAFRYGMHLHPHSQGLYIVEYMFVVLSPCAFIAADYVLLGRLARHLQMDKHLLVSSRRITIVFISSDITTFLIQASGGALTSSAKTQEAGFRGSRIFLGGLIVQLASFLTFSLIYAKFLYGIRKHDPEVWTQDRSKPWYKSWRALANALVLSCIGILIRSTFRVIELSQGFDGPITRTEGLFYGLDTLPLFIAVAIYIPFWPGRFIGDRKETVESVESAEVKELDVKI